MDKVSTQSSVRDRLASTVSTLWGEGKGMILLTVSCGWLLSLGVQIVYPALLPDIMTEFRIDYTGAGFPHVDDMNYLCFRTIPRRLSCRQVR